MDLTYVFHHKNIPKSEFCWFFLWNKQKQEKLFWMCKSSNDRNDNISTIHDIACVTKVLWIIKNQPSLQSVACKSKKKKCCLYRLTTGDKINRVLLQQKSFICLQLECKINLFRSCGLWSKLKGDNNRIMRRVDEYFFFFPFFLSANLISL